MTETSGSGQRPADSASKAEWVDYAERVGVSRADAEGMTKDQLLERVRSTEQGPQGQAPEGQQGPQGV